METQDPRAPGSPGGTRKHLDAGQGLGVSPEVAAMSPRGTGYTSHPEDTGLCLELVGWRAVGLWPWE